MARERLNKRGFLKGLTALLRLRLVIPMIRSKKPPEYTAKGALVGMAWAMTPLVGIQMYLVFMTWLIAKRVFKWGFSLPVGLAWTWVTNVFTMPFFYYAFYVTGKLMTGTFASRTTYTTFSKLWKEAFADQGIWEALKITYDIMVKDWGSAMFIGSVPWAIVGGVFAYYWTLWYLAELKKLREKRLAKKAKNVQQALQENTQGE